MAYKFQLRTDKGTTCSREFESYQGAQEAMKWCNDILVCQLDRYALRLLTDNVDAEFAGTWVTPGRSDNPHNRIVVGDCPKWW